MSTDISHLSEKVELDLLDDDTVEVLIVEGDDVKYKFEASVKDQNPYSFDASPFLTNAKRMDLYKFFSIASQLIKNSQDRGGIEENKKVKLVEEYPPEPFESFGDEVIAYRVLKREPALMNSTGTGRPQRKTNWYHDYVTSDHPNKVVIVESRPIDHLIEFTCWAKSNKLANSRAIWLEKLFVTHTWAFEIQGVERFLWKDRGPDTYMTTGGQRLFYRPVNFFVRLREFEVRAHPQIKKILLELEA